MKAWRDELAWCTHQGVRAGSRQQRDVRPEWAMVEGWGLGMWAGGLGQMLGTANFPWSKRLMGAGGAWRKVSALGRGVWWGQCLRGCQLSFGRDLADKQKGWSWRMGRSGCWGPGIPVWRSGSMWGRVPDLCLNPSLPLDSHTAFRSP